MIDGKNVSDQPVKNDKITYENIRKVAIGQGDDYTTGCLLDYIYFKKYQEMIAIDLNKQQALHTDPKTIEQNNFKANQIEVEIQDLISFFKKQKKLSLNFHKEL